MLNDRVDNVAEVALVKDGPSVAVDVATVELGKMVTLLETYSSDGLCDREEEVAELFEFAVLWATTVLKLCGDNAARADRSL